LVDEYPLSPTTLPGKCLGLPRPARFMLPPSISASNTVHSFCWPGVSKKQTGLPLPSHLTWILVLKPPRLLPKASAAGSGGFCGSPFLHRRHFDAPSRCYRLHNGSPTPPLRVCHLASVTRPALGPRYLLFSSDTAGRRRSWGSHSARASPPIGHRSLVSTRCRLLVYGGPC
jgi:hypothetical protein